jgi:tetratricopeptide (TPR) repeat protein
MIKEEAIGSKVGSHSDNDKASAIIQRLNQHLANLLGDISEKSQAKLADSLEVACMLAVIGISESELLRLLRSAAAICLALYEKSYHDTVHRLCRRCITLSAQLSVEVISGLPAFQNVPDFKNCQSWSGFFITLSTYALRPQANKQVLKRDPPEKYAIQDESVKANLIATLALTTNIKADVIFQQWQLLEDLANYFVSHSDFATAMTYHQAALLLAEAHLPDQVHTTLIAIHLTLADLIYGQLPEDEDWQQGLMVAQVCRMRLLENRLDEVRRICDRILFAAECFGCVGQWEKAWYVAKCMLVWAQEKPWKLDRSLAIKAGALLSAVAAQDKSYFHQVVSSQLGQINNKLLLPGLRKSLKDNLAATTFLDTSCLLKHFNDNLRDVIQKLFEACCAVLGTPMCDYILLALGSLARHEACAYSDLEFAIIIPDEYAAGTERQRVEHYFRALMLLFECHVVLLGETPLPLDGQVTLPYQCKGFRFDEGGNVPFKRKVLFGTTAELLANLDIQPGISGDTIAANVLQEATYLLGDKTLYQTFDRERHAILYKKQKQGGLPLAIQFSLHLLRDHVSDFGSDIQSTIDEKFDIKKNLLRLVVFTLSCLKLHFGLEAHSSWECIDALVAKGIMQGSVGELLKHALAIGFRWRLQAQLFYGQECEVAYLTQSENAKVWCLDLQAQDWLALLLTGILQPLVKFLEALLTNTKVLEPKEVALALEKSFNRDESRAVYLKIIQHCREANAAIAAKHYNELAKKLFQGYANFTSQDTGLKEAADAEQKAINALLTNLQTFLSIDNNQELFATWHRAVAQNDCTSLPFWAEKKWVGANPYLSSGLCLFSKFCQKEPAALHRKHLYRQLLRDYPVTYRQEAIAILCAYEVQESLRVFLIDQIKVELPCASDGRRSTFIAQKPEEALLNELDIIFKPYDTHEEVAYQARKRIQIRLSFKGETKTYLLDSTFQDAWLEPSGYFKESLRTLLDGKRIVVSAVAGDMKVAHGKVYPEMPGIQSSVDKLLQRLSGVYVPSLLAEFSTFENTAISYPVLFSQTVPGKSLQEMLRNGESLESLESSLDPYHFTWRIIETLVFHYEDDKADNIIASPFIDVDGQTRYRLISIDNDHVYVDALIDKGILGQDLKLQLKSILFCFRQMYAPLDPNAVAVFLQLNWYQVLTAWLEELERWQKDHIGNLAEPGLFSMETIKRCLEAKPNETLLPCVFEPGTIKAIATRFWRLQATLQNQAQFPNNHLELVRITQPRLAQFFVDVLKKYPTPEARFAALPTEYVKVKDDHQVVHYQSQFKVQSRLLRSITIPQEQKKKDIKSALAKNAILEPQQARMVELVEQMRHYQEINRLQSDLIAGKEQAFAMFTAISPYLKEQVLRNVNFKILPQKGQQLLLNALTGAALYELHIQNCATLTDSTLLGLLKSMPDVRVLVVAGCHQIGKSGLFTNTIVDDLFKACPSLEVLNLSGTGIMQISSEAKVLLTTLTINDCKALKKIWFTQARMLVKVNVMHCPQLTEITLPGDALQRLDTYQSKWLSRLIGIPTTNAERQINIILWGSEYIPEGYVFNRNSFSYRNEGFGEYSVNTYLYRSNQPLSISALRGIRLVVLLYDDQFMHQSQLNANLAELVKCLDYPIVLFVVDSAKSETPLTIGDDCGEIAAYFRSTEKERLASLLSSALNNAPEVALLCHQVVCEQLKQGTLTRPNQFMALPKDVRQDRDGKIICDEKYRNESFVSNPLKAGMITRKPATDKLKTPDEGHSGSYSNKLKVDDKVDEQGNIYFLTTEIWFKPDNASAYHKRGNVKLSLSLYAEAIKDYSEAIRSKPNFVQAYTDRGNAQKKLGWDEEAIKDYEEAIRLKSDDFTVFRSRGALKANLGRYEEAIKDYEEAIRLLLVSQIIGAGVYNDVNDPREDVQRQVRGHAIDEIFEQRADAKIHLGRYEEARTFYGRPVLTDFLTLEREILTKTNLGQHEEALRVCDKVIRFYPDYASTHYYCGMVKANLGQYAEAIKDYEEAIRLKADYAHAFNKRGIVKFFLGQYEEAALNFNEAIRFDPKNIDSRANLGYIFLTQRKIVEAESAFRKALDLQKNFPSALQGKALILFIQGEEQLALASLREISKYYLGDNHQLIEEQAHLYTLKAKVALALKLPNLCEQAIAEVLAVKLDYAPALKIQEQLRTSLVVGYSQCGLLSAPKEKLEEQEIQENNNEVWDTPNNTEPENPKGP